MPPLRGLPIGRWLGHPTIIHSNNPANRARGVSRVRIRGGFGDNRWALILLLFRAVSEALFEALANNSHAASADGRNDDGEGA